MQSQSHWIVRLLYNNNPFYLISGLIILVGLHSNSLGVMPEKTQPGGFAIWQQSLGLSSWMAGYALMMALTAICVVRIAKVWEDARTIYLIVVLSTLGISVICDQLCIQAYSSASMLLMAGLAFSIILVEGTLRASRLRLPIEYRLPLYLMYFVFFGTPLLLSSNWHWVQQLEGLKVVLFPLACSLTFLTLMPAIRRGRDAMSANGSPWIWPYYPWSLFVILLVAVLFRSSALAVSFGPLLDSSLILNPLFLLPLGMVALVLLMELALVENLPRLRNGVLIATPALLLFGMSSQVLPFQTALVSDLAETVADPVVISAWCIVLIYFHFYQRGIAGCRMAATFTLAVLCFPTSSSSLLQASSIGLTTLAALPFVVEFSAALAKRTSHKEWISSGLFFGFWVGTTYFDQFSSADGILVGTLATTIWFLVVGLILDSQIMKLVRGFCAVILSFVSLGVVWSACFVGQSPAQASLLSWFLLGVTASYFLLTRRRGWKWMANFNGLITLIVQLNVFRDSLMPLIDSQRNLALVGGLSFFLVGVLITSIKAGALTRFWERWNKPTPKLLPGF